jgi:hypothetical protein
VATARRLASVPLHPLLLPAYAVLFLYAGNVQLVDLDQVSGPLAWAVGGGALVLVLASLVLRDVQRGALVASALAVSFYFAGHVAVLLGEDVPASAQLAGWALLIAAVFVGSYLARVRLPEINRALSVVAVVLIAISLGTIVPYVLSTPMVATHDEAAPSGLVAQRTTQRDIYYFVFDRYGSNEALWRGLGITSDLPDWLAGQGFTVAPDARANYVRTTLSLASVLDMTYLDEVAAEQGPQSGDYRPLYGMLQQNLVARFLREQGYRFVYLGAWFNPTRTLAIADQNFEHDSTTEFEAVLYDTTVQPLVASLLPTEEVPPEDQKHLDAAQFQLRTLPRVIGQPGPKFVMAHILLPHDPYVFDAAGNYRPRRARAGMTEAELFADQLAFTNSQIRQLVSSLLAVPAERQPIILIQADEGPYPLRYRTDQRAFDWSMATTDELEMKYGILDAFYLPPEPGQPADVPAPYPTISSVNTFRLVLSRYFGLDLPLLPDRSFTSAGPELPYDLTEITDRLPAPQY